MKDYFIEIQDIEGYNSRNKKYTFLIIAISAVIGLIAGSSSDWKWGILVGSIVFLIQFFKMSTQNNSFITQVNINANNHIEIKYNKENKDYVIEGDSCDFVFKKESGFSKTRSIYLAVYFKNELQLEQFETKDWTESKFDEIIAATNKE